MYIAFVVLCRLLDNKESGRNYKRKHVPIIPKLLRSFIYLQPAQEYPHAYPTTKILHPANETNFYKNRYTSYISLS